MQSEYGARSSRVWIWLAAYVAVVVAVFLWLRAVGVDGWVASSRANYFELKHDSSRDPKLGATISLPETDVFGRPVTGGLAQRDKVLLVLSGGCGECSEKGVNLTALQSAAVERVVLVYSTPASDIPLETARQVQVRVGSRK